MICHIRAFNTVFTALFSLALVATWATPTLAQPGARAVYVAPADSSAAHNAGVFVGVQKFDNPALNLNYPVDDAVSLAHLFVVELGLIPPENCYLRISGAPRDELNGKRLDKLRELHVREGGASKNAVNDALGAVASRSDDPGGLIVVTISSHGKELVTGNAGGVPGSAAVYCSDSTGTSDQTLLAVTDIEAGLKSAKAGKRVFFVDACRVTNGAKDPTVPADPVLWAALAQAKGSAVLLSCRDGQFSWDVDKVHGGAFSVALRDALTGAATADRQGLIRLDAVVAAVRKRTQELAWNEKQADQTPELSPVTDVKATEIPLARMLTPEILKDPKAPVRDRGRVLAAVLEREPELVHALWIREELIRISRAAGEQDDAVSRWALEEGAKLLPDEPSGNGRRDQENAAAHQLTVELFELGFGAGPITIKDSPDLERRARAGDRLCAFWVGVACSSDPAMQRAWYQRAAAQGLAPAQNDLGGMLANGEGGAMDKAAAREWFCKAAEQNIAAAQFNCGVMLDNGWGGPADKVAAREWYRKAAEQNYANAQNNFAVMLDNGEGGAVDKALAREWYRKAADQNLARAQFSYGVMLNNGQGGAVDKAGARQWYRRAAEQNIAEAQFNYAAMLSDGEGGLVDKAGAREWYRKAAEQNYANAQYNFAVMLDNGAGGATDKAGAREWYRKAAEQNHAQAQCNYGFMLNHGEGGAVDKTGAREWYRKAAEKNDAGAEFNYAIMLDNGEGGATDKAGARDWYSKAAGQNYAQAQYNYGVMLERGQGGPKDKVAAREWYRRAAEQGQALAQFNYGNMLYHGEGGAVDKGGAREWYRKAAEQDQASAQFNYGVMLANGEGGAMDKAGARESYGKAAEQNDADAQLNFGNMLANGEGGRKDVTEARRWYRLVLDNSTATPETRNLARQNLEKLP
jgi:TPR repeat protein